MAGDVLLHVIVSQRRGPASPGRAACVRLWLISGDECADRSCPPPSPSPAGSYYEKGNFYQLNQPLMPQEV